MHRLLDYALYTPEDPRTSDGCAEQRCALLERKLARRDDPPSERTSS